MNYLQICNMDDIIEIEHGYIGHFIPQNYNKWHEFDAEVLFIEGVHQFCVKIVKKFSDEQFLDNRIIPAQIRSLELTTKPTFDIYFILANYEYMTNTYLVKFKVFSDSKYSELIASGDVYLSKLK